MKAIFLAVMMIGSFWNFSFAESNAGDAGEAPSSLQTLPKVKGVVRRIDIPNAKITLKHEAIPNLDMPGMTMPFGVQNPRLLQGLKAGDKVLFTADSMNGALTVMSIEKRANLTSSESE